MSQSTITQAGYEFEQTGVIAKSVDWGQHYLFDDHVVVAEDAPEDVRPSYANEYLFVEYLFDGSHAAEGTPEELAEDGEFEVLDLLN